MAQVDEDHNGTVDPDEFAHMIRAQLKKTKRKGDANFNNVWHVLVHRVVLLASIKELWSDVRALSGQNQAKSRLDKKQAARKRAENKRCFLLPTSKFRLRWDMMQVLLLILTALMVPFRLCFDGDSEVGSWTFYFDIFSDSFFISTSPPRD
jgi:hypothetical protein